MESINNINFKIKRISFLEQDFEKQRLLQVERRGKTVILTNKKDNKVNRYDFQNANDAKIFYEEYYQTANLKCYNPSISDQVRNQNTNNRAQDNDQAYQNDFYRLFSSFYRLSKLMFQKQQQIFEMQKQQGEAMKYQQSYKLDKENIDDEVQNYYKQQLIKRNQIQEYQKAHLHTKYLELQKQYQFQQQIFNQDKNDQENIIKNQVSMEEEFKKINKVQNQAIYKLRQQLQQSQEESQLKQYDIKVKDAKIGCLQIKLHELNQLISLEDEYQIQKQYEENKKLKQEIQNLEKQVQLLKKSSKNEKQYKDQIQQLNDKIKSINKQLNDKNFQVNNLQQKIQELNKKKAIQNNINDRYYNDYNDLDNYSDDYHDSFWDDDYLYKDRDFDSDNENFEDY